jgi:hypothetical protein
MRRSFVTVGLAILVGLSAVPAQAQTAAPPAQQPAAPAADPYVFDGPMATILAGVKPDKTADFEGAFQEILKALAASDKPENKAQAAAVAVYKVAMASQPGQPVVYLIVLTNPGKQSFDLAKMIYYSGAFATREAQDAIYAKFKDIFTTFAPWPLVKIG